MTDSVIHYNIKRTLEIMLNVLKTSGYFPHASVGEPKAPPKAKISAHIWVDHTSVVDVFLDAPRELHTVIIRVYKDMIEIPEDKIELEMADAVSAILNMFYGKFTLDDAVLSIDIGGIYEKPVHTEWGHVKVGNLMYRIVDVYMSMIVDQTSQFERS